MPLGNEDPTQTSAQAWCVDLISILQIDHGASNGCVESDLKCGNHQPSALRVLSNKQKATPLATKLRATAGLKPR